MIMDDDTISMYYTYHSIIIYITIYLFIYSNYSVQKSTHFPFTYQSP